MSGSNDMAVGRHVNLGDIARRGARRHRHKTALIMGERRLTYGALNDAANKLAQGLLSRGLGRGARVAVLARNSIEFMVLYFACGKAGSVMCPANPDQPDKDLVYILNHAEVEALFVDEDRAGRLAEVARQVPSIRSVHVLERRAGTELTSLEDLAIGMEARDPELPVGDRDIAMVMYTSGTTSAPKGAMLSHTNVVTGAVNNAFAGEVHDNTVATAMLPLFHCGQLSISSGTLLHGGTVVIMDGFQPQALLESIERERITWIFALPAMYRRLLTETNLEKADTSSLEFCLYAMTPMDQSTLRHAIDRLGVRFALTSGQTEAYPPTVVFTPEFQLTKSGQYWGRSTPLTEVAIMDDDLCIVPDGEVGEIVYRGPMILEGYLKDPEATQRAFAGGWFHSGDLGLFDEDGLLVFVDRKKDMIKSGGENVSSVKVESCLLAHADVSAAAVLGVPHPYWGEAVVAAVVAAPDAEFDEKALITYCKAQLAPYEVPKKIVQFTQMPQTSTGKLQKFALRKELVDLFAETGK
ncbi:MAG: AMP-binding protein [Hydrogenophaga sp.]|uniref:class I adenylate-forming enzyme family protein n=1 Tax=Hydrogenophaga sp. TaxID=1904254 RepID=UPI0026269F2C|nr:AMP-binding protein [Hydrogenophaga sp.]MCV0437465.1 AMP-binding protein [Hydrogenophaga sp.]